MKRSLKALLAIAASSATALSVAAPSIAANFGTDDDRVFTGVYARQFEATRSCSIRARAVANEDLFGGNYTGRGTTVRLARKSGNDDATGSVRISFDAVGANAVYFDEFEVGSFGEDISNIEQDNKIKGSLEVTLDGSQPLTGERIDNNLREEIISQIEADSRANVQYDELENGKLLASISNDDQKAGLVVGGQIGKGVSGKEIQDSSGNELGNIFQRPVSRDAVVKFRIKDVGKIQGNKNAVVQARLVCAPLIYDQDDGIGTIRPN